MKLPLEGITVLEFCQYMAGPSAGLRLADLGARVIKIERPKHGEGGRKIAIKNLFIDGSSLVFHTANRNKESFTANLKDPKELEIVKKLIAVADVMTQNFRPGVMEKVGLDFLNVKNINPKIIYASITGYGKEGPWKNKPGQDLLIQSVSGLTYLTGHHQDPPTPMGLAVADMYCGTHLAQGILTALIRRQKTMLGCHVEVSLLESAIDMQFEVLTTFLNDNYKLPRRPVKHGVHTYLSAPYGIFKTSDGHIALAMGSLTKISDILGVKLLNQKSSTQSWLTVRDKTNEVLNSYLIKHTTQYWLDMFEPKDIWCSNVFDYKKLLNNEGYKSIKFEQSVSLTSGETLETTRCPIHFNDKALFCNKGAPRVGEHTQKIIKEFQLQGE